VILGSNVYIFCFVCGLALECGTGSVVGIATGYGLDGPGI
jgi:hypothetical protein